MSSCPARSVSLPSHLPLPPFSLMSVLAATGGFVCVSCGMNTVLTSLIPASPRCYLRLHPREPYSVGTNCHSDDLFHLPCSQCILAGSLLHRGQWDWHSHSPHTVVCQEKVGGTQVLLQGCYRVPTALHAQTQPQPLPQGAQHPGRCLKGKIRGTLVAGQAQRVGPKGLGLKGNT